MPNQKNGMLSSPFERFLKAGSGRIVVQPLIRLRHTPSLGPYPCCAVCGMAARDWHWGRFCPGFGAEL